MICSSCNIYIPTSQPVYCCIDQIFCSKNCSNTKFFIIKNKDPYFENPHDWNDILNNSSNNKESINLLENENEFEFIINIRKHKSRKNLLLILDNMHEDIEVEFKNNYRFKKYIKLIKFDKLIKYIIANNIICKYKLHIISIIIYSLIIYGIYKLISIKH